MMEEEQILRHFCMGIIKLDRTIAFVGIVDNLGILGMTQYRDGFQLLPRGELESYVMQDTVRMVSGKGIEAEFGKLVYTFALYEKVKRVTIPLTNPKDHMLVLLFDVNAEHESIILNKILPHLQKYRMYGTHEADKANKE